MKEIAPGDAAGRGRVLAITTKGALPYELTWRLEILEAERPRLIRLKASGELVGFGEWRLAEAGGEVTLTYTWRVRAEHPILRRLEFLLKPIFALNHNWVMRKGEEGMKRELGTAEVGWAERKRAHAVARRCRAPRRRPRGRRFALPALRQMRREQRQVGGGEPVLGRPGLVPVRVEERRAAGLVEAFQLLVA